MMVRPFVLGTVRLDQVVEPEETVMTSPVEALETQAATLVWSMVDVQVGLEPVQAAKRDADANAQRVKSFTKTLVPWSLASTATDLLLISARYVRTSE